MRTPAVVMLLSVAAAGCASKADVEVLGDSVRSDMEEIRAGQAQLLNQVRGGLDSLDAAGLRRETTGRGEFERRVARLEDAMEELLEIASQNNQLLNDLYQNRTASAGNPGRSQPMDTGRIQSLGQDEPSQFYGLALEQFTLGNYETARGAFRNFLTEHGSHDLAPDAQYYIARTYEDANDVGNALAEFQRVTELYPNSNRAAAALYRRGLLEVARGNTAIARRLFTQVEAGYANSPEAPLARQELAKLGN